MERGGNHIMEVLTKTELTMDVKELADSLGVSDRTIRRHIEKLYPEKMKDGTKTLMNEIEVTAIKLDLQNNPNLDEVVQLPKTKLEKTLLVKQAFSILNDELEELKKENEELKPKAQSFDKFLSAGNWQTFNVVAHVLEIGRNTMLRILREHHILMNNNIPYQPFVNEGYFKTIEKTISLGGVNEVNKPQTFVSPKGLEYIRKLLARVTA